MLARIRKKSSHIGIEKSFPGKELLAHNQADACGIFLHASAVPEDSKSGCDIWRDQASVKNLETVAGPFGGAAPLVRQAEGNAAFRTHFVEKESRGQAHGISWSAGGN